MSRSENGIAPFPPQLNDLKDPPGYLYYKGALDVLELDATIAIVGARTCSPYGATVARQLARDLAAEGYNVVNGFARGIDGEALRGALEANGSAWAVMGCGVDRIFPRAHTDLYHRLASTYGVSGGGIISEYEHGTDPAPWRFPARNRIIAALACATIVVEARERSGSLITAGLALELKRPVFAVPGEITSHLSYGTNRLIVDGRARAITSADDVLAALDRVPDPSAA